jgi:hypothetical protein
MKISSIFQVFFVSFNIHFVFSFSPNREDPKEKTSDLREKFNWQLFDCPYSELNLLQKIKLTSPVECKQKCEQMGNRCSHIYWSSENCLLKFGKVLNQINIELDKQNMLGMCAYKQLEKSFFSSFVRAFKVFVLFNLLLTASYLFAEWIDKLNKLQLRVNRAHANAQQHENLI